MFTQSDVQILVSLLPPNAVKQIQEKTTISTTTIKKFLRGEKIRADFAQRIYEAALSLVEEINSKESLLRKKTAKLLKGKGANI